MDRKEGGWDGSTRLIIEGVQLRLTVEEGLFWASSRMTEKWVVGMEVQLRLTVEEGLFWASSRTTEKGEVGMYKANSRRGFIVGAVQE